ncbi:MAG: polysaccharide deacetylase family protein [Bacteroidales bacterium]|nr:polysaccharide deacetylase family protein [Bacteroidales bacterium]
MKINFKKRIKIRLLASPPKYLRFLYGRTVWKVSTNENELFITFDDGPVPELTPWVLDTLKSYNAKATFFCVGDNVRKYPELYDRIRKEGHGTGNHSYSHLNGFKVSLRRYIKNVFEAKRYIDSDLFRPPYGSLRFLTRLILKSRFRIIMWDILSMDYDRSMKPRQVVRNVIGNVTPGSIVVFHDNLKAKTNLEYTLPRILDYYSKRGYSFVNLQERLENQVGK